ESPTDGGMVERCFAARAPLDIRTFPSWRLLGSSHPMPILRFEFATPAMCGARSRFAWPHHDEKTPFRRISFGRVGQARIHGARGARAAETPHAAELIPSGAILPPSQRPWRAVPRPGHLAPSRPGARPGRKGKMFGFSADSLRLLAKEYFQPNPS